MKQVCEPIFSGVQKSGADHIEMFKQRDCFRPEMLELKLWSWDKRSNVEDFETRKFCLQMLVIFLEFCEAVLVQSLKMFFNFRELRDIAIRCES